MIRVKVTTNFPYWPIVRQTPAASAQWDECRFFINEPIKECDFWVVQGDLPSSERVRCPKGNTMFLSCEPHTVRKYDRFFLNQFDTVITCQDLHGHPGLLRSQLALPWWIGIKYVTRSGDHGGAVIVAKSYDALKHDKPPIKSALVSLICSTRAETGGHVKRLRFIQALRERLGDRVKIYGRGIEECDDKWEAIARYKYHIVLENSFVNDYWTEKLADAFLGGAYPFYYGCPNIWRYFPKGALTAINIDDPGSAIDTIEHDMAENVFEKSHEPIAVARGLILDKYNMFAVIAEHVSKSSYKGKPIVTELRPDGSLPATHWRRWARYVRHKCRQLFDAKPPTP